MATKSKKINDSSLKDENPNKPLSEKEKKSLKTKQIIGISVLGVLLVVAIVMTVLAYTIFNKK